jgi:hypothetical protein
MSFPDYNEVIALHLFIAALDNSYRHARQVESWLSRHLQSLSWTDYTLLTLQARVCQLRMN